MKSFAPVLVLDAPSGQVLKGHPDEILPPIALTASSPYWWIRCAMSRCPNHAWAQVS